MKKANMKMKIEGVNNDFEKKKKNGELLSHLVHRETRKAKSLTTPKIHFLLAKSEQPNPNPNQ